MPIIVLDGPEKAGKSTLAAAVAAEPWRGLPVQVRHWGRLDPHNYYADRVYLAALRSDCAYRGLVVWDRSWLSGSVYGQLLDRRDRLRDDPWLGEWLYGRAVLAGGQRVCLLGPDAATLEAARSADDLPVSAVEERELYRQMADRAGWTVLENPRDLEHAAKWAAVLRARADLQWPGLRPPLYAGPLSPRVLVVGEAHSRQWTADNWLPFASCYTTRWARSLGWRALEVGWTNAAADPEEQVVAASTVVACGTAATEYCLRLRQEGVHDFADPATLYRWGQNRRSVRDELERLASVVESGLGVWRDAPLVVE